MADPDKITLRSEVNRPLSWSELDDNFNEVKIIVSEVNQFYEEYSIFIGDQEQFNINISDSVNNLGQSVSNLSQDVNNLGDTVSGLTITVGDFESRIEDLEEAGDFVNPFTEEGSLLVADETASPVEFKKSNTVDAVLQSGEDSLVWGPPVAQVANEAITEHKQEENPHTQYLIPPPLEDNKRRVLAVNEDEDEEVLSIGFGKEILAEHYIDKEVKIPSASGAVALDLSLASVFDVTLSSNTTLSPTNIPVLDTDEVLSVVVRVRQGATARTLTWWGGIAWLVPSPPPATPAANKIIEYILSWDGSSWIGRMGARN